MLEVSDPMVPRYLVFRISEGDKNFYLPSTMRTDNIRAE